MNKKIQEKFIWLFVNLAANSSKPVGNIWHIICTPEEVEELKKLYPLVDNTSWSEYNTETVIDACGNNVILPK